MSARYLIGDVFDGLAQLPDDSVDLVFSSPPFLALRSYLPADHPDKAREIGSEATPGEFLDVLLDVVEACDRVLAPHGSLVFELGDTYAGSGGRGEASITNTAFPWRETGWASEARDGNGHRVAHGSGWPLDKSLCMIPESFAWALAYGRNPFTGRETPRWRVRNVIAWCRPNPPVGALGDKVRPATSYLTVATHARDRWFDLDAVRERLKVPEASADRDGRHYYGSAEKGIGNQSKSTDNGEHRTIGSNPAGAPPLDYWVIPTEPYEGAHYATFPRQLVVKPVKAMCPQRVCTVCGEPSRRIVESYRTLDGVPTEDLPPISTTGRAGADADGIGHWRKGTTRTEVGWSDCGHDAYRAGVVLDPFAGSGTTLAVATGHGRDAIGIDIDQRNAELALERVGPMFLEVVSLSEGAA